MIGGFVAAMARSSAHRQIVCGIAARRDFQGAIRTRPSTAVSRNNDAAPLPASTAAGFKGAAEAAETKSAGAPIMERIVFMPNFLASIFRRSDRLNLLISQSPQCLRRHGSRKIRRK